MSTDAKGRRRGRGALADATGQPHQLAGAGHHFSLGEEFYSGQQPGTGLRRGGAQRGLKKRTMQQSQRKEEYRRGFPVIYKQMTPSQEQEKLKGKYKIKPSALKKI